jgi:hypothetical protein
MWYRIKKYEDNDKTFSRKFVDSGTLADMKADGKKFEIETTNKWLEGVINEMDENYSDGEVLDEVQKLIDEGECWA